MNGENLRTVKTASGARAVQIVHSSRRGSRDIEHIGSAHDDAALEGQITIGLLTDASGFPLMVNAFGGNRGETTTMLPTIRAFMDAHQLADVTVVADAGMISAANQQAIEATGLSFILGARTWQPRTPAVRQAAGLAAQIDEGRRPIFNRRR